MGWSKDEVYILYKIIFALDEDLKLINSIYDLEHIIYYKNNFHNNILC